MTAQRAKVNTQKENMIDSNSKLFQDNLVYKPFHYPYAVEVLKEHENRMHWGEHELDLSDDVADWKTPGVLEPAEKDFIIQILRMFTQSDVAVGAYYLDNLIPIFRNNEVRNMLTSFATREGTHQRAYALLNDTLGLPEGEYAAFRTYKEMADKDDFMRDADTSTLKGLALGLAKATFNEGVSLFASFIMLLNFQRFGKMKGMGKVVEWSVKDETKHVEGVSWLFRQICQEHPEIVNNHFKSVIYNMARRCVELEDAFIDLAYKMGSIKGLDSDGVKQYIRFIADRRLIMLGLKGNFKVKKNPLPWVDIVLNAADHTNFFENKVAEYEVGGLEGEWDYNFNDVRVYGKEGCPYCVKAKDWLVANNVDFDYIDLSDDQERNRFYDLYAFENEQRSVPKIFKLESDKIILLGGYNELVGKGL